MPSGRKWGGVARRGAGKVDPDRPPPRQQRHGGGHKPPPKERREPKELSPPPPWEPEVWIREPDEPIRATAGKAVSRGAKGADKKAATKGGRPRRKAPEHVSKEIGAAVGKGMSAKVEQRLMEAARAVERERYRDADRILKTLVNQAPDVPAVRELYGVNLYLLGRWSAAATELELFRKQTGSVEQNPVLADSYRALRRYAKADKLWEELRTADAPGELVTEGRIVAAGCRADRGKLADAIRLLEQGPVKVKKPKDHHLRLWYALADLYERAGDTPRARELFKRIVVNEPDFADSAERLSGLD